MILASSKEDKKMSKRISNYFELKDVCRSAGLWYVGSFMIEFIRRREQWENEDTKADFIEYMYKEYDTDSDLSGTRTRVNAIIRIIESGYVKEALEMVINADPFKLGCEQSRENAKYVLEKMDSGEIQL